MISRVFQPSIYKSNLKRMWIFPLLYGIGLLICNPYLMRVITSHSKLFSNEIKSNVAGFCLGTLTNPYTAMILCLVAAVCVFSYLYTTRSAYMLHAFPVTRLSLFGTSMATGLTMLILPKLICAIAAHIYLTSIGFPGAAGVWIMFCGGVLIDLFFFGLAVFVMLCCGRTLSAVMMYFAVNYLYTLLRILINEILQQLQYGVELPDGVNWGNNILTPSVYMGTRVFDYDVTNSHVSLFKTVMADKMGVLLAYAVAGLVLMGLAFLVYRFRNIETAGSFLSMDWTKPIVRWVGAFGVGGYIALLVVDLGNSAPLNGTATTFAYTLAWMIALCGLSFVVFQMLIERTMRIFTKKRITELGLFCAAIAAIMTILYLDPMGNIGFVPEGKDIELAGMVHGQSIVIDDEASFEDLTVLHKKLLDEKNVTMRDYPATYTEGNWENIRISYVLKNGKTIIRNYYLRHENGSLYDEATAIANHPAVVKRTLFGDREPDILSMMVMPNATEAVDSFNSDDGVIDKEADCKQIYKALVKDIDSGNIKISNTASNELYSMEISFDSTDNKKPEAEVKLFSNEWYYYDSSYVSITGDAVNTNKTLKKLGYFDF